MKIFVMILLLAIFVLPLSSVAEESAPDPEAAPVIKEEKRPVKKHKKAKKKAVSALPQVNADVRNLKVGQEGDKAVATYDLVSSGDEGVAEVTVAIIIDGKRRTSDQLSLSGDFGKNVRTGARKRIVWNATADLPKGFDGELNWDVRTARGAAAPSAEPKVSQKVDGPSYEDTVNFIVNKYSFSKDDRFQQKINSVNNCMMSVSWVASGTPGGNNYDMKLVTSVYLEPPPEPDSIHVTNVCMESSQIRGKIPFWMNDATFAERFAKALNHLRKLCGAKDDPF
jgi:Na+-transporting methylmalonyl-CoA/oxaloacetate decarboxylase gamma subunit